LNWLRWSRRISVRCKIAAPSVGADLVNDQCDDDSQNDQRRPEDPCRLRHAASRNVHRVGSTQAAEHHDRVAADGHIFAQPRGTEEVDQIVSDSGVVFGVDSAKEDHNIVLGLMRNVHVAKKNDDVVIDIALGIDAAEEADGVMDGLTFRDDDITSKLHSILFGTCRRGGKNHYRRQQESREQALSHGDPHAKLYARETWIVPKRVSPSQWATFSGVICP